MLTKIKNKLREWLGLTTTAEQLLSLTTKFDLLNIKHELLDRQVDDIESALARRRIYRAKKTN